MKHLLFRAFYMIIIIGLTNGPSLWGEEEILSLPGMGGNNGQVASGEELILLPGSPQASPATSSVTPIEIPGMPAGTEDSAQAPSPEIVIDPLAPDPVAQPSPAVEPAITPVAATNYPVMPKDTSSAVFMVMKTWECQDYDLKTLIEHATSVYGQEAEDKFEVKGLAELAPVNVTIKEEDVTLDELLDVVTRKHGLDWGVDVSQKTIYVYPGKK